MIQYAYHRAVTYDGRFIDGPLVATYSDEGVLNNIRPLLKEQPHVIWKGGTLTLPPYAMF